LGECRAEWWTGLLTLSLVPAASDEFWLVAAVGGTRKACPGVKGCPGSRRNKIAGGSPDIDNLAPLQVWDFDKERDVDVQRVKLWYSYVYIK